MGDSLEAQDSIGNILHRSVHPAQKMLPRNPGSINMIRLHRARGPSSVDGLQSVDELTISSHLLPTLTEIDMDRLKARILSRTCVERPDAACDVFRGFVWMGSCTQVMERWSMVDLVAGCRDRKLFNFRTSHRLAVLIRLGAPMKVHRAWSPRIGPNLLYAVDPADVRHVQPACTKALLPQSRFNALPLRAKLT